jgi:hypothetical protein
LPKERWWWWRGIGRGRQQASSSFILDCSAEEGSPVSGGWWAHLSLPLAADALCDRFGGPARESPTPIACEQKRPVRTLS